MSRKYGWFVIALVIPVLFAGVASADTITSFSPDGLFFQSFGGPGSFQGTAILSGGPTPSGADGAINVTSGDVNGLPAVESLGVNVAPSDTMIYDLNFTGGIDNTSGSTWSYFAIELTGGARFLYDQPITVNNSVTGANTFAITSTGAQFLEFRFGGAPDLSTTTFDGIQIILPAGAGDFDINFVVAVPEPTSLTLLGLASCGGAGVWWRRRRKSKTPALDKAADAVS